MAWIESRKKQSGGGLQTDSFTLQTLPYTQSALETELPIFNYGNITGLNPEFANNIIKFNQVGYADWSIGNDKISRINSPNSSIQFYGKSIKKGKYHKLCIEVDVLDGSTGNYNLVHVGIKYNTLSNYLDGPVIYIPVTDCYERKNCSGTTPWYRVARCFAEVDISGATDDFYITFHACDAAVNIYSIWLE